MKPKIRKRTRTPEQSPGGESERAEARGYEIGYCRPPLGSRWKPGQSGNKKGRPKGALSFGSLFAAELDAKVTIIENGRERSVSKRHVIAKHVVARAAKGEPKMVDLLLKQELAAAAERQVDAADGNPTKDERSVLDEFLELARQQAKGEKREGDG